MTGFSRVMDIFEVYLPSQYLLNMNYGLVAEQAGGIEILYRNIPDSNVHGANMGPTWVLSSPCGPHVGPVNLAIWD